MDFIEKPPYSGYTSILVIVDHLSKQSLFILTHDTIMSPQLAQLFILHVFSKHSFPSHVNSNHSTEFVSHFFWSLRTALEMKLHFIPDIILKVNGLTKWTKSDFGTVPPGLLQLPQDNWSELLPLAEFTYNNTLSATTSITPFLANKGYLLNITIHPECDLASMHACDFVTDLNELHQQLR